MEQAFEYLPCNRNIPIPFCPRSRSTSILTLALLSSTSACSTVETLDAAMTRVIIHLSVDEPDRLKRQIPLSLRAIVSMSWKSIQIRWTNLHLLKSLISWRAGLDTGGSARAIPVKLLRHCSCFLEMSRLHSSLFGWETFIERRTFSP